MKHLTPEQLSALHDGALKAPAADEASRHLASCAACRTALDELVAGDAALATAFEHDPGDAYFERLAERIDDRIAREAAAPVPAKALGRSGGAWGWLMSPRGLSIAGAAAVVVVGAAIVLVTARQAPLPDLRDPKLAARGNQVAPKSPSAGARRRDAADGDATSESAPAPALSTQQAPAPEQAHAPAADRVAGEAGSAATERSAVPSLDEGGSTSSPVLTTRERERAADSRRARGFAASPPPATASKRTPAPATAPQPSGVLPEESKAAADRAPESPGPKPLADAPVALQEKVQDEVSAKREGAAAAPRSKEADERQALGAEDERASAAKRAPSLEVKNLKGSDNALGQITRDLLARGAPARLCGVVRDPSGRPISGAQVALSDLGRTVRTSAEGRFCIDSPAGDHTATVMAVGYESQRRSIRIEGSSGEVEFTLHTVEVIRGGRASEARFRLQMPDSFSTWPEALREQARRAQQRVDSGLRDRAASRVDQGAAEWERVLGRARGGDYEVAARERIGEARYLAWEMAPTAARAQAAIETLTAYLTRAPMGPARDRAAQRLDRVRR